LRDQFFEPVGEQGYYSAYDYVQKNVRNSVVWVENGLLFYAYDASFSNTVSRSSLPDYVVGFKTDWHGNGGGSYPTLIEEYMADPAVQIAYQDPQDIVLYCP
jgi:hypothetical protein